MEITSLLEQFIMPVVLAGCYTAGMAFKSTGKYPDKYIPVTMFFAGGVLASLITKDWSVQTMLTGAISGWASTGLNQTIKQLSKGE